MSCSKSAVATLRMGIDSLFPSGLVNSSSAINSEIFSPAAAVPCVNGAVDVVFLTVGRRVVYLVLVVRIGIRVGDGATGATGREMITVRLVVVPGKRSAGRFA